MIVGFTEIQVTSKFVIRDKIGLGRWSQMIESLEFQNEELLGLPETK